MNFIKACFLCIFIITQVIFLLVDLYNSLCLSVLQSVSLLGKCQLFSAAVESRQPKFSLEIPLTYAKPFFTSFSHTPPEGVLG